MVIMAMHWKIFRCSNVGNFRNLLGNTHLWYNYPCVQQIAGLKQTIEEKLNIPAKPKRPLTPYFKFMAKIRPEIKKEKPDAKVIDIVREVSARWEKIDTQTKEKLETEYKKEQEIYAKERLQYDTNLTQEQRDALKEARIKQSEQREKRKLKKKCKENNKPKKPCSAFVLYMKSELPKRGSKSFRVFQRETADNWQKLSETEKKPFNDEMHDQMKMYQKQMVEWERKMIKIGNTDIVRQDALIEPKPTKIKMPRKKPTE